MMAVSAGKTVFFAKRGSPLLFVPVRYKAKVNIQKPKPPHFLRACTLEAAKPMYKPFIMNDPVMCVIERNKLKEEEKDHPIEIILGRDLRKLFIDHKLIVVCHVNSIKAEDEFEIRKKLHKINMKFKKYPRRVFELALENTPFINVLPLIQGFWMDGIVYSEKPNVAQFLKIQKKISELIPLAAIVENQILSKPELVQYSNLPSLDVMRSQIYSTLSTTSQHIIQNMNHHQTKLTSLLDQYIKDKSKGE